MVELRTRLEDGERFVTKVRCIVSGEQLTHLMHDLGDRIWSWAETRLDKPFVLVGIESGGVPVASWLAREISERRNFTPSVYTINTSGHRDDFALGVRQAARASQFTFDVAHHPIVLVDDVLQTGRTARSAIAAVFDLGRPPAVMLAVLVDRGHRELPIRPDFVGKSIPTSRDQKVVVNLSDPPSSGIFLFGPADR